METGTEENTPLETGTGNTPMETGNDFLLSSESFLGFLTSLCVEEHWPGCENVNSS